MKQHIVTIAKDGKTTVETKGYEGSTCQQATQRLEQRIGRVESDDPTPEMYVTAEASVSVQQ